MKVVAIIQARTGSTRLPEKIFLPLCGKPLIWHIFNRVSYSIKIDECILATTTSLQDDKLAAWAESEKINYFRGNEDDVLLRFYKAAEFAKADIIVRITADDPFKDPVIIDRVIDLLNSRNLSFTYNNKPPSYPEGLDVEVFTMDALRKAQDQSSDDFEREHVTQFFYRNPEMFSQANLSYSDNLSHLRWTLDTDADYSMVKVVYENLYQTDKIFLFQEILDLLNHHPEIVLINNDVKRSAMYQ